MSRPLNSVAIAVTFGVAVASSQNARWPAALCLESPTTPVVRQEMP